jgi:hypothetical protein
LATAHGRSHKNHLLNPRPYILTLLRTLAEAHKTKTTIKRQRLPIQQLRFRKKNEAPDSWIVSFQQSSKIQPVELRKYEELLPLL